MAKEYIEREALKNRLQEHHDFIVDAWGGFGNLPTFDKSRVDELSACIAEVINAPAADVVEVVHGYHVGDVCIYGFGHENKSRAIVEIVRILNDERGVAEVKFLKVFVDDTGDGLFNYLLKSGKTMNASFQYLKNITPRMDGE